MGQPRPVGRPGLAAGRRPAARGPARRRGRARLTGKPNDDTRVRAEALLARAYDLAGSGLEGINEAAEELAAMSGENLEVISLARRLTMARLAESPDAATAQVASLIRRALELGGWRWTWEDTGPVP